MSNDLISRSEFLRVLRPFRSRIKGKGAVSGTAAAMVDTLIEYVERMPDTHDLGNTTAWLVSELEMEAKRLEERGRWGRTKRDIIRSKVIAEMIGKLKDRSVVVGVVPELCAETVNMATGELIGRDYRCGRCGMGVAEEWVCCPYCGGWIDWIRGEVGKGD